jgi:hypothetical protein
MSSTNNKADGLARIASGGGRHDRQRSPIRRFVEAAEPPEIP